MLANDTRDPHLNLKIDSIVMVNFRCFLIVLGDLQIAENIISSFNYLKPGNPSVRFKLNKRTKSL